MTSSLKSKTLPLNHLPQSGREFFFSEKDELLNPFLKDILKEEPYEIHFEVKPLGNNKYEMKGEIKISLNRHCSFCSKPFLLPLQKKISEIFIVDSQYDESSSLSGHHIYTDKEMDEAFFSILKEPKIPLGSFFHEFISSMEPFYPIPKDCEESCVHRKEMKKYIHRESKSSFNALSSLKSLKF